MQLLHLHAPARPEWCARSAFWLGLSLVAACDRPAQPGTEPGSSTLVAERPSLVVEVTDPSASAVSGAWVVLSPGSRDAQTGVDGRATFHDLGAGDFTAAVTAAGYAPAVVATPVTDEDTTANVALAPVVARGTEWAGLVLDRLDEPAAGIEIVVDGVALTATDAAGVWKLTPPSGTTHNVVLRPPPASNLAPADLGAVTVTDGGAAWFEWSLAAVPPADSHFLGTTVCAYCHADIATRYEQSAHGRSSRAPWEAELDADLSGLVDAFTLASVVSLSPKVAGATLTLGVVGDTWQVTVRDRFGGVAGPLDVMEVYGGSRAAVALAVDADGTDALVPAAWALAGSGASSEQAAAGWVPAWTEGWFDATGHLTMTDGAPGAEAQFALQCAGCHATGAALAEQSGQYELTESADAYNLERGVGCEACHDRGGAHAQAFAARQTTILNPAKLHPSARVEVCARCHERNTPTAHPFADTPGWLVDGGGQPLGPVDLPADYSVPAPVQWLAAGVSKVGWDQVGDFRDSPHRAGAAGYLGICEDCHDPHGSTFSASLKHDPDDNDTCTSCHATMFPDEAAEAAHAHHGEFAPGPWSPGSCTGCHFPRMGIEVRPDAVSGAGELHSHGLTFIAPSTALAEFDAAGAELLPLGLVPVPACLDCHLQADALAGDSGEVCACGVGSPLLRSTYEDMQEAFDIVWGGAP